MTWVGWRLQRTETLITAIVLVALTALLVPTGLEIAHSYQHDGLSSCLGINPSRACDQRIGEFQTQFQTLFNLTNWFTLIPGLIGVALAAPFILELEHGTYRLAWTQSITRGRWLAGKLGLPVFAALIAAGILIGLATWWRAPYVHLNGRLDTGTYDSEGTVVVGYTLFALALALALGVVWRRSAAALTLAFAGYFAARIFVDTWLRDRLVSPLTTSWKGGPQQPASLFHARILNMSVLEKGGAHLASDTPIFGSHAQMAVPHGGTVTFHAVYLPASSFWPLQLTETGLFAGTATALILFAAWWTHRRVT
ncbi:MAG: hypothetical protein ACXVZW_02175 [Gaiellaceae bacterium]